MVWGLWSCLRPFQMAHKVITFALMVQIASALAQESGKSY
jgi:hypothetical protein